MSWPPLRIAALVLAFLAIVLTGLAQILPLATYEEEQFTVRAEAKAYVWKTHVFASGFGIERSDTHSWYNETLDDEDGIDLVRAAGPVLAIGGLLMVAAIVFLFAQRDPLAASLLALLGAAFAGVGLGLAFTGLGDFFDDRQEWALGLWLAIAGLVMAAIAGILGLVARRPVQPEPMRIPGAP